MGGINKIIFLAFLGVGMAEMNTAWLLREWALWIHEGAGYGRGFGNCTLASIIPPSLKDGDEREHSTIDDGLAMHINSIMEELKKVELIEYQVLRLANEQPKWGYRRIAAHLKISRYFAAQIYSDAYEWVDARLSIELKNAA